MTCSNRVSYYVPRGYDYRETLVRCGNTDPHGGRAVCDQCASDQATMRQIAAEEETVRLDNEAARSAGWGEF